MSEAPKQAKDMALALLMAGLVVGPAFLYSIKSDLPHVFLISALLLGISLLKRQALAFGDRPLIYCAVATLALTIIPDMAIPMNDNRIGILDIVVKSSLTAPALLYLAAMATFFEQRPMTLGIVATLTAAVCIVGGDLFPNISLLSERLPFLNPIGIHFKTLYASTIALQTLLLVAALQRIRRMPEAGASKEALRLRLGLKALLLVALPLLAINGVALFYANERALRSLENLLSMQSLLKRGPSQETLAFSKEVDLKGALPQQSPEKMDAVVLRAKCAKAPGRLRARSYDSYADGKWSSKEDVPGALAAIRRAETLSYNSFFMPWASQGEAPGASIDVFMASAFANTLMTPGNVRSLDIVADRVSMSPDGYLEALQWKLDGGCTMQVPQIDQEAAFPQPAELEKAKEKFLELPEGLRSFLDATAKEALTAQKPPRGLTGDAATAEMIALSLRSRCSYSLETEASPEGVDPVVNFLDATKKGHCELFASAATLLLRSQGIPARYVCGIVCEETHPSGGYFIARVGNAHAWCEAYLRDQGRWTVVEATPPSSLNFSAHKWSSLEAWYDWLSQAVREAFADIRRGYFAQAVMNFLGSLALLAWSVLSSLPGAVVAALAAAFFVYRAWRKAKAQAPKRPLSEPERRLRRELARLEKALSKRAGSQRRPSWTLDEWAAQGGLPENAGLKELLYAYKALRYREAIPEMREVEAFKGKLDEFLGGLRRS